MSATSEAFLQLRAEEMAYMYAPDFTKKDAQATGIKLISDLIESGEADKLQVMANLCRLKEVVNAADAELRKHLPEEKVKVYGVEFTPTQGGETLNYTEDPIYRIMKEDLDARAELLKLAQKQAIIDGYGNEVPKVSTTPRKSSVTIKF